MSPGKGKLKTSHSNIPKNKTAPSGKLFLSLTKKDYLIIFIAFLSDAVTNSKMYAPGTTLLLIG